MKSKNLMIGVFLFILLALAVLLIPSLILPFWIIKFRGIERKMESVSHNTRHQIISEIGERAELLSTMNSSASNLARLLNSSLPGVNISFGAIQDVVSPLLFQVISTNALTSYISYTGVDNLFFSYRYKDDQLLAVYTNSSQFSNTSFYQQVDPNNGKLYGEPSRFPGRGNVEDFTFVQTVDVAGKGFLSLAFQDKMVVRFFSGLELFSGYFCLATREGKVIVEGVPNTCVALDESLNPNGTRKGYVGNVTCEYDGGASSGFVVKIEGSDYRVFCRTLDIFGVQSVYKLALPLTDEFYHGKAKVAFMLIIAISVAMIISVFVFVFTMLRAARREMYLCSALIKQMEATQQAERKHVNKSLAFASASHDVRAALTGITGLTEMSQEVVDPASELGSNLKQIEACTKDLLGILNSILDMSKIEAGKMQLEEVEFDVAQLLEDVVDLFYPAGLRKGVDVILDPCDGSIFSKYSKVKGDRTKLKQIISNLLSNAVKFTSEGHVVVRGWAKKPSLITPLFSSKGKSRCFGLASCLFSTKNEEVYDGQSESRFTIQENSEILEFVFEVEDTGIGIPKEKQNSIFENYVQVKESTHLEHEGTGLGLGIVQSLVRLMGGEIKIIDKEVGTKGTCFRFNIFLAKSETVGTNETTRKHDSESRGEHSSRDSVQHSGPRPSAFSPKPEHSRVVLFIQGEARRKISQKFMERVGVKVSIVKEWNQLSHTLKKVKRKLSVSKYSTSSVSDLSLSSGPKSVPLSSMEGEDDIPAYLFGRATGKSVSNFVLVIIDTSGGPFRELSRAVADFRKDFQNTCCRIVWIDKPGAQNMIHSKGLDEDKLPLTDLIISKPFHGSRLFRVIGLLPEFGGTLPGSKRRKNTKHDGVDLPPGSRFSENDQARSASKSKGKEISGLNILPKEEILSGKKILLVDDNAVLRKIAIANISKLGATVESCENGEEAVKLVSSGLSDRRKHRATTSSLPYDYILMDCEMPVMDGFEATRRIREEEGYYDIRIPIIALTAHTSGEEADRMLQNGVDYFLSKPLKNDELIEAILQIDTSN